jgi:proline iminopeptidase
MSEKSFFEVSDGHRLYVERRGKHGGIPVLFVHGGPGSGFSGDDVALFDPERFDALFFEQRGAGRSEPFASLHENHTDALVDDMVKLLDAFGFEKVHLFGGSWGSTLSLVFAIRHPERVLGMNLRGIFLANEDAIEHFVGGGVADFYPEVWERFVALVPDGHRGAVSRYYLERMTSGPERERERFCYEWARYELSIIKLDWPGSDSEVAEILGHYNYRSLAPLEAHYMANRCFLPENYLLANAGRLPAVPVSIVHGRYDVLCPPKDAYELHRRIPDSRLRYVPAGHASSEPAIREALVSELERLR